MRFGSLFSGIGGFDLGFERAGMECAWQVEIDSNCQSVLKKHFEGVKIYNDVREVGRHNLEPVDLICGGFPCQDLSVAGKREGLAGERSGLWFEFARIIDELEPKWVVIENVPGLLSSHKGRDFAVIVQWLAKRGYGLAWRILDSQYFGIAQRRRRVFVVASFGNGSAAEVLFESESMSGNTSESEKTKEEITGTLATRAGKESSGTGYRMTAFGEYADDDKASTLKERDYKDATDLVVQPALTYTISQQDDGGNDGAGGLSVTQDDKSVGISSKSKTLVVQPVAWEMHHASEVYRESKSELAPTLQARMGTGGNNIPLVGVRRLTPVECERLQGFPDGWTEHAISDIIDVEILLGETLCQLVQSTDVKEKLSTEIHHFALCTTSDGKSGEVQMLPIQMTEKTQGNVKLKIVIDLRSVVNYVCGTISRGKDMATQFGQTKTLLIEKEIESQDVTSIVLLLSAKLEGNLPRKKLFIISTWIEEMIEKKIYMFLKTNLNTQKLTELSISVSKGLCASELLCLRMGLITQNSDSHRYKQLGNAVTVNVAEWIGKRIVVSDKGD